MDLSKTITCGFCNNVARMEIIGAVNDTTQDFDPKYGYSPEAGVIYEVNRCPKCQAVNIVSYGWHDGMESEEEIIYETLYPINPDAPIGLPVDIKSTYEAAEQVKSINVNAYAILMRRLLELVCIDRNAKGKHLFNMLQDLAERNEIPEKLVEVANGLKNFGNVGAHAGIGELTEKEIPIVESLTRAILEYIYSAPYLATLAENKLEKIKGKKIGN